MNLVRGLGNFRLYPVVIGKGITQVLAEAGAKVLVTALTEQYLQPLAEEMAAAGHPIDILQADATRAEDWERTVQVALERWGHIDVLINNLGDAIRKPLVPLPLLNPGEEASPSAEGVLAGGPKALPPLRGVRGVREVSFLH